MSFSHILFRIFTVHWPGALCWRKADIQAAQTAILGWLNELESADAWISLCQTNRYFRWGWIFLNLKGMQFLR
jgi:hypothetical protein